MGTHLVRGYQLTFNFAGTILPTPPPFSSRVPGLNLVPIAIPRFCVLIFSQAATSIFIKHMSPPRQKINTKNYPGQKI